MKEGTLILLRHGESVYNQAHLFTGWTDVELSEKGVEEAKNAGRLLKKHALFPDICFTSWLKRSIHTVTLALAQLQWEQIDTWRSWKLNERHYGDWQQRNKDDVKADVGEKAFLAVRRGYDTPPPPLPPTDPRSARFDRKYAALDPQELPDAESLADTRRRTVNYFYDAVAPQLCRGKTVLLSAHGNSLRALVMMLEQLDAETISGVEIPTGVPMVYRFDETLSLIAERKDLK